MLLLRIAQQHQIKAPTTHHKKGSNKKSRHISSTHRKVYRTSFSQHAGASCVLFPIQSMLSVPLLMPLNREDPARRTLMFVFVLWFLSLLLFRLCQTFFSLLSLILLFRLELRSFLVLVFHAFYWWWGSLLCCASSCCLIPFVCIVSGLLDLLCCDGLVLDMSGILCSSAASLIHGRLIATIVSGAIRAIWAGHGTDKVHHYWEANKVTAVWFIYNF